MTHCRAGKQVPVSLLLLGCLLGGCIFDTFQPAAPLTMQYIGDQGDTVPPLAVLRFAFSDSLTSPLDFAFTPPVAQPYAITFNTASDTAALSFVEMLPGNTRYALRLKSPVVGENGSTLDAGSDSVIIYTAATEAEPNNTPATADTLRPPAVYGMLGLAADTDVYCIAKNQNAFYCEAFTGRTSFSVKDSFLQDVPVTGGPGKTDTFTLPDTTHFPVYVTIFSPIKGTAVYYKFGMAP
jgi:hypothetical protein